MAESHAMIELLTTRTVKEELKIEVLEQQRDQDKEYHKQRMKDLQDRRWEEQEFHMAKLADLDVDIEDIRRRCRGTDAETQCDL